MKRYLAIVVAAVVCLGSASPSAAVPRKTVPAKAAVVMDSFGTVLYAKHPKARLAPASTVKLVTAMVAIDLLMDDANVVVSKKASRARQLAPKLAAEEAFSALDLLHLTLMRSTNPAAVALAEASAGSEEDFVALMNLKAREAGATDTRFMTASGLPKGTQYTTANDLALIMKAALSYPLIREILAKKEYTIRSADGREIHIENSNSLLRLEQAPIIGKTGFTGNARHCFVGAMETETGPVFTAVLGARSRTSLWRATTMLAEVGANPELAGLLESPPANLNSQAVIKKSKKMAAGSRIGIATVDLPQALMFRGYKYQLQTDEYPEKMIN